MRRLNPHNNNKQNQNASEYFNRSILWGILSLFAGVRGIKLGAITFLGPIAEEVLGFTLEDIGEAIKREQQKKELERKISQIFDQSIQSLKIPSENEDSPTGQKQKLFLPDLKPSLEENPLGLQIPDEKDTYWLDIIKPPSIVLILGGRGSGKTVLGYRLLELFRYKLTPYVIGLPQEGRQLIPDWMGIEENIDNVPSGSISLVDEAYLSNHARDWIKDESKDLARLLNLSRQQDKTMIYVTQQGRQLNLDIVSSANVIVIKKLDTLQIGFERPALRQIISNAREAFETLSGDLRKWSYAYAPDVGLKELVENDPPSFWDQKLSRIYGQGTPDISAVDKHPPKMTLAQKKQKAKELKDLNWPLSRIAKKLGASKSTVFNWIHDYPYRKNDSIHE